MTLRDRWVELCHRLPPFRGRLAIARIIGNTLLSSRRNRVAFATLNNGYRVKVDLGWSDVFESLYYFRTYEDDLMNLIRASVDVEKPGYIDVGANVGVFCFSIADILHRRGGRALAIEPAPGNFAFLEESIHANGLESVITAVRCAAGDREGTLMLSQLVYGEVVNAVPLAWGAGGSSDTEILRWNEPWQRSAGVALVDSPMTTLDRLVTEHQIRNVQFVKIDVEGAEMFVLAGARALLAEQRPIVYAEFHQPLMAANRATFDEIAAFCSAVGYEIRFLGPGGMLTRRMPGADEKYLNPILIPVARTEHQNRVIAAFER